MKMFRLVQNELIKIFSKIGTWVLLGILLALSILSVIVNDGIAWTTFENPENWKAELEEKQEKLTERIDKLETKLAEKAEESDLEEFDPETEEENRQLALDQSKSKIYSYRIENNIKENPIQEYLMLFVTNRTGTIPLLVGTFIIIIASGIVSSEFSMGTIKLLMIRPVNRVKILLSKYIATLVTFFIFVILSLLFALIVGGIFLGFEGISDTYLYLKKEKVEKADFFPFFFDSLFLCLPYCIVCITLAFTLSAILRSTAFTMAITLFFSLMGPIIVEGFYDKKYTWLKFLPFSHADFTWHITGVNHPLKFTFGFSITMLLIYFVIFFVAGFIIFNKRDIAT